MADALVLGTSGAIREGSTPSVPTTNELHHAMRGAVQRLCAVHTILI
jgi:hypothetical protein